VTDVSNQALLGPVGEQLAQKLDTQHPSPRRDHFSIPHIKGRETAYLAGNSLGLRSTGSVKAVSEALDSWGRLGVLGHLEGEYPWMPYAESLREMVARLVGAKVGEAVVMNSLTVNLHTMLTTFYRPTRTKPCIVVEYDAFPSDRYAVRSQTDLAGFDPSDAVIALRPSDETVGITVDDVDRCLRDNAGKVAIVMLGGVNFRTGAYLDIEAITKVVHAHGCVAGWDLAHAVGNVPLHLHDWNVDFAVWCSYKYLNAGPGSLGGCYVHERHGNNPNLSRPAGWWGHDPNSRFAMPEEFVAQPGAEGWQVSNPPILSIAAVRGSLEMFDEAGMDSLRSRSLQLTAFLHDVLSEVAQKLPIRIVTPSDPSRRGAQLSIEVDGAGHLTECLAGEHGVIGDDRPPNIIRFAPTPLYNTFHDCWRVGAALNATLGKTANHG
jgi:kynureninase